MRLFCGLYIVFIVFWDIMVIIVNKRSFRLKNNSKAGLSCYVM